MFIICFKESKFVGFCESDSVSLMLQEKIKMIDERRKTTVKDFSDDEDDGLLKKIEKSGLKPGEIETAATKRRGKLNFLSATKKPGLRIRASVKRNAAETASSTDEESNVPKRNKEAPPSKKLKSELNDKPVETNPKDKMEAEKLPPPQIVVYAKKSAPSIISK